MSEEDDSSALQPKLRFIRFPAIGSLRFRDFCRRLGLLVDFCRFALFCCAMRGI